MDWTELLTFEVEIELFIELEGAIVVLPFVGEEAEEPLGGQLLDTVLLLVV